MELYFFQSLLAFNNYSFQRILDNNKLSRVPDLKGLTNLESLFDNFIFIKNFHNYYFLLIIRSLFSNSITSLPDFMSSLTSLRSLYLENNSLKKLPKDFSLLSNLRVLYLYYFFTLFTNFSKIKNRNINNNNLLRFDSVEIPEGFLDGTFSSFSCQEVCSSVSTPNSICTLSADCRLKND